MSRPRPKPLIERARAAERLALDGANLPLRDLVGAAGHSELALLRFGRAGRAGVYLDVIRDPHLGWLSSVAAVQRFHRAVAAAPKPGSPRPAA